MIRNQHAKASPPKLRLELLIKLQKLMHLNALRTSLIDALILAAATPVIEQLSLCRAIVVAVHYVPIVEVTMVTMLTVNVTNTNSALQTMNRTWDGRLWTNAVFLKLEAQIAKLHMQQILVPMVKLHRLNRRLSCWQKQQMLLTIERINTTLLNQQTISLNKLKKEKPLLHLHRCILRRCCHQARR